MLFDVEVRERELKNTEKSETNYRNEPKTVRFYVLSLHKLLKELDLI